MAVKALVHAFSPINAISSLCAIVACHPEEDVEAVVLHYWPGGSDEMSRELKGVIRQMLSEYSWIREVVSLPQPKYEALLLSEGVDEVRDFIISLTSFVSVDEIYYAHDVCGEVLPLLATVYPGARRICYGDSMGQVVDKRVHLGYLGIEVPPVTAPLISVVKDVGRRLLSILCNRGVEEKRIRFREFSADAASLVIPVDQSGNSLKKIPVHVCPRKRVIDIFYRCSGSCPELQGYIRDLLAKYGDRDCYLFLTENNAEGNFIDFERETEMYSTVIRENCRPGSVVFIKSHPGETLPRNERLSQSLSGEYEIIGLEPRYKRYPIELWKELVASCRIICLSYPTLSLKYLYGIDVIQPMDDAFIEKWFPEWTWASYKNAITLYMEPLKRLSTWDGKGVLWSPEI